MEKIGIDAAMVSDHNRIDGALEIEALNPVFRVIVSEEIHSAQGEVIGAFIRERIPPHKPLDWTIDAVHEQGGLVIVSHPFVRVVWSRITRSALFAYASKFDIIEVVNARNNSLRDELAAMRFARMAGLPVSAGSDAHLAHTLGRAYVRMKPFTDAKEFLENIKDGTLVCEKRTPLWLSGLTFIVPFVTLFVKTRKIKLTGDDDE
jgi:predicted metal-dependent phosphoesterase TrpH